LPLEKTNVIKKRVKKMKRLTVNKLILRKLLPVVFLLPIVGYAQLTDGYYNKAFGLSGSELADTLYAITKNHIEYPYTSSATDVWDILKETDMDTLDANNVIFVYTGYSVNAEQEYNGGNGWTREHVWAKSRGGFDTNAPAGTDVHNLKPADRRTNSVRNNRWFDTGNSPYFSKGDTTGCFTNNQLWVWEPRDPVKGDIARIIFYMDIRYNGENGEPDLRVIDSIPHDSRTNDGVHAKLSTLIQWHMQDPVDDWERRRNDIIYKYQQNRNPFIDHPEFVELIWERDSEIEQGSLD
jgi:endonuclease I